METICCPSADVTTDAIVRNNTLDELADSRLTVSQINFERSVSRLRSLSQSVHPDTGIHGQILSAPRISKEYEAPSAAVALRDC